MKRLIGIVLLLVALGCGAVATAHAAAPAAAPATAFAPYVDLTDWPTPNLVQLRQASGIREATLAFVTASGTAKCAPSWGGQATEPAAGAHPWDRAGIAAFATAGATDAISFGGEDGAELATVCPSAARLERVYASVLSAYHPARLDFDIEGVALADTAANTRRAIALAQLQRARPATAISFTLPVLPSGLTPQGVAVVRDALRHHVRIAEVNLMTMDFGDSAAPHPAGRMATYVIDAATHTLAQLRRLMPALSLTARERMLGVTPMIGRNDTRDEIFTLADADRLAAWARDHDLGLLSMWALQRDRSCPQPEHSAVDSCSGLIQAPDAFSRAFGA